MCTVAIGLPLYDDRSLKGHFLVNSHPVQDPFEPASSLQPGSFLPETFPSEICLLRNYITYIWEGKGVQRVLGRFRMEQQRTKGFASRAASSGTSVLFLPQMSQPTAASNH